MTIWSNVPAAKVEKGKLLEEKPFVPGQPYDPHLADEAAKLKWLAFNRRFWQLLVVVSRFWLIELWLHWIRKKNPEFRRARAERLRQILIDLGPTFIKVGQFLSVRRDLLPLEIAEELSLLQDQVPPFDLAFAKQTIKNDLGQAPDELFSFFEPVPIASASIGQVHKVKLQDGTWAVVKIQRQDLWRIFCCDLGYMRVLIRLGRYLGLKDKSQAWLDLSDEFGRTLFAELDFIEEGRNADKMRRLLRAKPQIKIPRVFWKYTGRRVLTLEYLPGTKIDQVNQLQAQGFDLREIGNLLVECYLEQIVISGFFHADPHAGNLAVDIDGNVVIYDFGMMGWVTKQQRRALAGCIRAVSSCDPVLLAKYLSDLGVVRQEARLEPIVRTVKPFIDYYGGKDILDLDFRHLEHDIDKIIEDQALTLPATLAYLLRAGSALEGIIRTLKPNFSFVAAARPVIRKWLLQGEFVDIGKFGLTMSLLRGKQTNYQAPIDKVTLELPRKLGSQEEEHETEKLNYRLKSLENRLAIAQRLNLISLTMSLLLFLALVLQGIREQAYGQIFLLVCLLFLVAIFFLGNFKSLKP